MINRAWKIAVICFLGYATLFAILALITVAGHMAHGDSFQQVPLSFWLRIGDWLLIAIGLPLVAVATTMADAASVHLSALHYLALYACNGICFAYFAKFAYLWRASRNADNEILA